MKLSPAKMNLTLLLPIYFIDCKSTMNYPIEYVQFTNVTIFTLCNRLPPFTINGSGNGIGEDSYVHSVLAPLLELTFDFERSSNHMWLVGSVFC